MNKTYLIIIFCMLCVSSCKNISRRNQDIPKVVDDAVIRLESSVVSKVEYYYLPESALTGVAVKPDSLIRNAPYQVIVREVHREWLLKVAQVLADGTYAPIQSSGDTRLGVIFYNAAGESFLSIFVDQSGKRALINESLFLVGSELGDTLRRPIRSVVKEVRP